MKTMRYSWWHLQDDAMAWIKFFCVIAYITWVILKSIPCGDFMYLWFAKGARLIPDEDGRDFWIK